MFSAFTKYFSTRQTSQTEPIPGSKQVPNSAGGYSFAVDDWTRLARFLILGSEGGSYYASERALTIDNARAVQRCIHADGPRTVQIILAISESGRAPKNDPAIFALAMCAGLGDAATKALALSALPRICRTGTHLFQFAETVQAFRGWGRGLRTAIAGWYTARPPRDAAYQLIKYQQRNGWSHRDVMRLAHFNRIAQAHGSPWYDLYYWTAHGWEGVGDLPHPDEALQPIWAFERAKRATSAAEIVRLIRDYRLVRECVPTRFLQEPEVWSALLDDMPMTAMIRNLGKMTSVGLVTPFSAAAKRAVSALRDERALRKARVHPLTLLIALRTYAHGRGLKGSLTWTPVPQVLDALDDAFYLAFQTVEPTGKRWLLGLDVSGSMSAPVAGSPLTCCEAATALAMLTARTEPQYYLHAFADNFRTLPITARSRLDDALRHTRNQNFGGTDCSLPMLHATEHRLPVDCFAVLTDSETWAGKVHPVQALRNYRQRTGIPAKLIVLGMTSNGFTIADPHDAGMLDCVGLSTDTPSVIADFAR